MCVLEQKPKRPTSSRDRRKTVGEKDKPKPKRPAARKKGGKGKDTPSPKETENTTHHDDPFQDPEKLYAVSSLFSRLSTTSTKYMHWPNWAGRGGMLWVLSEIKSFPEPIIIIIIY